MGEGQEGRGINSTKFLLCVMSILLVLIGILIGKGIELQHLSSKTGHGLPNTREHAGTKPSGTGMGTTGDQSQNDLNGNGDLLQTSSAVPYEASSVTAQLLRADSTSLTGRPCTDKGCTATYNNSLFRIIITEDKRFVLLDRDSDLILVQSSTSLTTLPFQTSIFDLVLMPSGLFAVTCPLESTIVFVDIDEEDFIVHKAKTKEQYFAVALGAAKNTLIVSAFPDEKSFIQIINFQGDVLKTIVESSHMPFLKFPFVLRVAHGRLVVVVLGEGSKEHFHFVMQTGPLSGETTDVRIYTNHHVSSPRSLAVDEAGNVFIGQQGEVVIRTPDGKCRLLLVHQGAPSIPAAIAAEGDRLVVAWLNHGKNTTTLREYQFLNL